MKTSTGLSTISGFNENRTYFFIGSLSIEGPASKGGWNMRFSSQKRFEICDSLRRYWCAIARIFND